MITTVSIRLALRKLAEITCGTAPSLIRVTGTGSVDADWDAEACELRILQVRTA